MGYLEQNRKRGLWPIPSTIQKGQDLLCVLISTDGGEGSVLGGEDETLALLCLVGEDPQQPLQSILAMQG